MIKTFRSKVLSKLWSKGSSPKIDARLRDRILRRLDRLNAAETLSELNLPDFNFHPLCGFTPTRYSVHVNGPWCLTFEFKGGHVYRVDFEQYH